MEENWIKQEQARLKKDILKVEKILSRKKKETKRLRMEIEHGNEVVRDLNCLIRIFELDTPCSQVFKNNIQNKFRHYIEKYNR